MFYLKKRWVSIVYIILALILFWANAVVAVHWMDRSLFPDYMIKGEIDFAASFGHGASLVFLISLLLFAISASVPVSLLITDIIAFALIFANQQKVLSRNEFLTFAELRTITSPKELLSFISVPVSTALLIVAATLLFIVLLQWVMRKVAKKFNLLPNRRMGTLLFAAALLCLTFAYVKPNSYNVHVLAFEKPRFHNWDPIARARQDGFLASFLHTVKPTYMSVPDQYTKGKAEEIFADYEKAAEKINKTRDHSLDESLTLIYLSESLMDPMAMPDLLENETPIPFIEETVKNNVGGTIRSPFLGGGTANIEWSVLTSFSVEVFHNPLVATPYSDFYEGSRNHDTVLSYYEDHKTALHPFPAKLYNRPTIYKKIGFEKFYDRDHGIRHKEKLGNHQFISDAAFNKDILETVSKVDTGLIQALTMQNHTPYDRDIGKMKYEPEINPDAYPKERRKELFNYLQGIHASDGATKELIEKLEASGKEVNFLFYGDHLPELFAGMEDRFDKEKLHETPWFLYMSGGRSEGGAQFEGLSPSFLVPAMLREGGYRVSPFQAMLDEMLEKGVRRIGDHYTVTDQGRMKDSELPDDLRKLVQDYRTVQYDALFGHDWLGTEFYNEEK